MVVFEMTGEKPHLPLVREVFFRFWHGSRCKLYEKQKTSAGNLYKFR